MPRPAGCESLGVTPVTRPEHKWVAASALGQCESGEMVAAIAWRLVVGVHGHYPRLREIADSVGAYLAADIA